MWHASWLYVTWLFVMLFYMWHDSWFHAYLMFLYVMLCYMWHDSWWYVKWLFHVIIYVTRHLVICEMALPCYYMWQASWVYVTWPFHVIICDMTFDLTHSIFLYVMFLYVTRRLMICEKAFPCYYMWHDFWYNAFDVLIRDLTHSMLLYVTCNTLQHAVTHCNTLQHTATHCNTLQHTVTWRIHTHALWHDALDVIICDMHHTATYCNTLQPAGTHFDMTHTHSCTVTWRIRCYHM